MLPPTPPRRDSSIGADNPPVPLSPSLPKQQVGSVLGVSRNGAPLQGLALNSLLPPSLPPPLAERKPARFNPLPTHSTAQLSNVKLRTALDHPGGDGVACWVAGQQIYGQLEVWRTTLAAWRDEVRVGEAFVVLRGEEEFPAPSAGRRWTRRPGNSNAVRFLEDRCQIVNPRRELDDDADGYRVLPKGKSSLPFQFHLPVDLPSQFQSNHGSVQYTVTGYLRVRVNGNVHILTHCKPIFIYQRIEHPHKIIPVLLQNLSYHFQQKSCAGQLSLRWPYGSGCVTAKCTVMDSFSLAGDCIQVVLSVANRTNKKLPVAKLRLVRIVQAKQGQVTTETTMERTRQYTKTISEISCKKLTFEPGECRSCTVELPIPEHAYCVLSASTFLVRHRVAVEFQYGLGASLLLTVPVFLIHPLSMNSRGDTGASTNRSHGASTSTHPFPMRSATLPCVRFRSQSLDTLVDSPFVIREDVVLDGRLTVSDGCVRKKRSSACKAAPLLSLTESATVVRKPSKGPSSGGDSDTFITATTEVETIPEDGRSSPSYSLDAPVRERILTPVMDETGNALPAVPNSLSHMDQYSLPRVQRLRPRISSMPFQAITTELTTPPPELTTPPPSPPNKFASLPPHPRDSCNPIRQDPWQDLFQECTRALSSLNVS